MHEVGSETDLICRFQFHRELSLTKVMHVYVVWD